ncbi:MAG: hypothetical protein HZY79_04320 [Rhodoblastus sp.]|nr:MAG: hypothetical protein HZY79_04320 [Rhodoblastus sp.]
MSKAGDHFAARDAQADGAGGDWAEVWGRRVGRGLGAVFFIVLVVNLFTRWFF